jgi:octaprenyl-diphosphate synthase
VSAIHPELLSFIEESLRQINLSQIDPVLGSPIKYAVNGRGKHLRPLICSLSTTLIGGDYRDAKDAIIAIELLHDASLIHDDIIDEDPMRRGTPSMHNKYGIKTAVLTGDAMFTLGLRYALKTGNPKIVDILTATTIKMLQGIAIQSKNRGRILTEEDYLNINYMKSGSLFEAAAEIGGMIASGTPREIERLSLFGRHYGNAYQILDDICDAIIVDKTNGSDLNRGDISLPLIYALESSDITREEKEQLTLVYKGKTEGDPNALLQIYEKTGAITRSQVKMREFSGMARRVLDDFNPSQATDALQSMLDLYDTSDILSTVGSDLLYYLK